MSHENVGKGWQLADVWCILMESELSDAKGVEAMQTKNAKPKSILNTTEADLPEMNQRTAPYTVEIRHTPIGTRIQITGPGVDMSRSFTRDGLVGAVLDAATWANVYRLGREQGKKDVANA